jgi:alkanesulfonate monooxygenase SsuD/methylene tetrahydromethanopterin reductase-like flavin-dependent oxidoreductase (luciferase family)
MSGGETPRTLRFGLHTRPYGQPVTELQRAWRWGEAAGFDWISVFDHFYGASAAGKQLPTYECLTSMAALAVTTERVRVGCMTVCVPFRHPGILAKAAVTIDHLSGGRAELGLGAGWMEEEFVDFGYEFPGIAERLDRLEEGMQVVRELFTGEPVTFSGRFNQLREAVCAPRPLQVALPLWVGGHSDRTLQIAVRHANGWNAHDVGPRFVRRRNVALDGLCEKEGRDPRSLARSINLGFHMGADAASASRKREALFSRLTEGQRHGQLVGTPRDIVARLGEYVEAGIGQVNLGVPPPVDWEALAVFTQEVIPAFRGRCAAGIASG